MAHRARRVSHHCSECGAHVAEACPYHPNATIDSILAGPGRPVSTGSDGTKEIRFRVSAAQRAELEAEAARLGLSSADLAAKRRVFQGTGT